MPLLYLHGGGDGCIGVSMAEAAGGEVVEGAGHFLHLERPGDVAGRVLRFVT